MCNEMMCDMLLTNPSCEEKGVIFSLALEIPPSNVLDMRNYSFCASTKSRSHIIAVICSSLAVSPLPRSHLNHDCRTSSKLLPVAIWSSAHEHNPGLLGPLYCQDKHAIRSRPAHSEFRSRLKATRWQNIKKEKKEKNESGGSLPPHR